MRTSPLLVRRALAGLAAAALVVAAAGCGDDGDGGGAVPTTTAPSTTEATTTTAAEGTTTSAIAAPPSTAPAGGAIPPAEGITPAYVEDVFGGLMAELRQVLLRARAAGRFDEVYFRDLGSVFTAGEGRRLTSGLQQNGGVDAIRPDAGPVALGPAELVDAGPGCVSFTMDPVDLGPLLTFPFEGTKRGSVRLVPAAEGAGGSPWRVNFLDRFEGTRLHPSAECPS